MLKYLELNKEISTEEVISFLRELAKPENRSPGSAISDEYFLKLAYDIEVNPPTKLFKTDGVSCFLEVIEGICVTDIAIIHDIGYWKGGSRVEKVLRDFVFGIMLLEAGVSATMTMTMVDGVRIGGSSLLPTPWRWGYGW